MHHNKSMLVCFFTFFSCCFELESVCLVCIIHIETCCDIVVFFLKIDRNRRRFDNECNEKLLCTRQEKQSVTIRGKIKSSACRSTVCEIKHKNEQPDRLSIFYGCYRIDFVYSPFIGFHYFVNEDSFKFFNCFFSLSCRF